MKNLKYYLNLNYTIRIKKSGDGSYFRAGEKSSSAYFGEIEELTGCMTEGDTKEEALEMLDDAKQAWLEVALERKLSIPKPEQGEFSGKFNVRLPKFLHRKLVYRAREENVSLNNLVSTTLASAIK